MTTEYYYIKLLWAGIAKNTRKSYLSATRSYEGFCAAARCPPWPATRQILCHWIVCRAYGGSNFAPGLGQAKGSTISKYVSALRSVHVDLDLPVTVFGLPHVRRLIDGAANLFPRGPSHKKIPITRDVLCGLMSPQATRGETEYNTLNLNAAFSLAFSGFLRMGEFTWTGEETRSKRSFAATRPTRRCITFSDGSMDFFLPRSKTDKQNNGVSILITSAADAACAVTHMQALLKHAPTVANEPLFAFTGGPFTRKRVMNALNRRLANLGIAPGTYTGHSFRGGAAQHAHEMQVPVGEVQHMGRWASDAIEVYYRRSRAHQIRMQRLFQTGQSVGFV